jgi:hypothetical protein
MTTHVTKSHKIEKYKTLVGYGKHFIDRHQKKGVGGGDAFKLMSPSALY